MSEPLRGIGVSAGFAVAPVVHINGVAVPPSNEKVDPDGENRVREAFETVAVGLEALAESADGEAKEILAADALIARDPALITAVGAELQNGKGPATAINDAIESVAALFESMGEYFADRVSDIRDVGARAVAEVLGLPAPGVPSLREPSVIVARDLTPAETAGMDHSMVAGIVTERGGRTSHTAILAAQYGIPAVVQVAGATNLKSGEIVAVDGTKGEVTVDPDEALIAEQVSRRSKRTALVEAVSGPGTTADGHQVSLLLNIGDTTDARLARGVDCEGVGLFRTEFLYLTATSAPSVEKQAAAYRAVFTQFARVVIRTLDAGADKPLIFADPGDEANPALGKRGLRLSQVIPELLESQLEAIAQAAAGLDVDVQVMAPMVSTAEEAAWFAGKVAAAGLPHAGVMIEVPAAALSAGHVLAEVEFGSLGTNDLAQYTMAADRTEGELAELLDPWQPAVLAVVDAACHGAREAGKPLGVCGESAGDPALALVLVGLGVTSLSMAPSLIPAVRASLAMHTFEECQQAAQAALTARTAGDARAAVVAIARPEVDFLAL